ncbi:MAG TPA: hypothetical protein VMT99_00775 [Candidatus Paceibacterota bacterium]|nr:hypothetical protein [Candidatus Paceibacterota bacterium]
MANQGIPKEEAIYDQLVARAESFYQQGQFLEAFLIQSCLFEGVIKTCVAIHFMDGLAGNKELAKSVERWQISKQLELLLIGHVIDAPLYKKLDAYIKQRNKVVHQLLTYKPKERDAALKKAYAEGKEMKTFIVDELIRAKVNKGMEKIEKAINEISGQIAIDGKVVSKEALLKMIKE